jgi:hypothetical protein
MSNKDYRKAYETAAEELQDALAQKKKIEARILSLRKTMNTLSTLLEDDKKWLANTMGVLSQLGELSLTDEISAAITQSNQPLTTTEIKNEVSKFSRSLERHKNPLATINAIAKRLVEQGKLEEVLKDGRKAWRAKRVSLLSMLLPNSALAGPAPSTMLPFGTDDIRLARAKRKTIGQRITESGKE